MLTFQYVSHRVLRWSLAAFALPLIFIINLALVLQGSHWVYEVFMGLQALFYTLSLIGWAMENRHITIKVFFIPYYFCMMNYAVFAGFIRWTKGKQKATWEKARRAVV